MDRTKRLSDKLLRDSFAGGLIVLTVGLPLVLVGCDTSSDGYQTFSQADADRVDQARIDATAAGDSATNEPQTVIQVAAQRMAQSFEEPVAVIGRDGGNEEMARQRQRLVGGRRNLPGMSTEGIAEILTKIGARIAAEAANGGPIIRQIKLLVPERSFTAEGPDNALRVSYDDLDLLKILNMDPVPLDADKHFPQWLRDLDGKQIRIRGFMYPTYVESDLSGFLLARDNQICCFGRNPKIYDIFPVAMSEGETTDYILGRPFDVVGVFHIKPDVDGDKLWQLYEIDDARVIDD